METLLQISLVVLWVITFLSSIALGYCFGVIFGYEAATQHLREHFDTLENEHHTD